MKKLLMRTSLVLLLIFGMAANAAAIPITGSIAFSGNGATDFNEDFRLAKNFSNFSDITTTNAFGDYSSVPAPSSLNPLNLNFVAITFNGFTFNPITVPVVPLWSFVYSGLTYSFDATSMTIDYIAAHTIVISGNGTARITGYEATNGEWNVTANHLGSSFSFSSSAAALPEPLTLILLGSGLLGLAGLRKKLS